MKFRVVLLPRAKQQLYNAALWWADNRSAEQALRWLEGFEQALAGLEYGPDRCPLARENDEFPVEIRQLLYGLRRKKTHRAVFEIREDQVLIHSIRHLAQRDLTVDDL